jgi:L,D-transpeptidase catalytic domain
MKRWRVAVIVLLLVATAGTATYLYMRHAAVPRSVADALRDYGRAAHARMQPYFAKAGVPYPPARVALLVFKREKRLSLWAAGANGRWRFIRAYPVLAASGSQGPKLREGDYQVPEGLYRIEYLNPASSYHLSMKVSYPNAFDREMAARDHRTRLGGDIFIHGKNVSIGCIAVGDPAIEELFTLVAETGLARTRVIVAPADLRLAGAPMLQSSPLWIGRLYASIAAALADFPAWLETDSAYDVFGRSKMAPVKP